MGVYLSLRSMDPTTDPARWSAYKLMVCMAGMGLSWGGLGLVVLAVAAAVWLFRHLFL